VIAFTLLKSTQRRAVPSGFLTVTMGDAQELVDCLMKPFCNSPSISPSILSLKCTGVLQGLWEMGVFSPVSSVNLARFVRPGSFVKVSACFVYSSAMSDFCLSSRLSPRIFT